MLSKLVIEGNHLNLIKSIYKITKANTILNSKRLNAFPLRLGTNQGCLHAPMLSSVELEVLAGTIKKKKKKEIKGTQIRKEGIKLFLCRYVVYVENPKTSTKNS